VKEQARQAFLANNINPRSISVSRTRDGGGVSVDAQDSDVLKIKNQLKHEGFINA